MGNKHANELTQEDDDSLPMNNEQLARIEEAKPADESHPLNCQQLAHFNENFAYQQDAQKLMKKIYKNLSNRKNQDTVKSIKQDNKVDNYFKQNQDFLKNMLS